MRLGAPFVACRSYKDQALTVGVLDRRLQRFGKGIESIAVGDDVSTHVDGMGDRRAGVCGQSATVVPDELQSHDLGVGAHTADAYGVVESGRHDTGAMRAVTFVVHGIEIVVAEVIPVEA